MWINKAVVGFSRGDAPKYTGEGVALCGTSGALGGPYYEITLNYSHFGYFSGWHTLDVPHQKHVTKFVDVTSFDNAMTSCMTSPHHTCIGHVTIYYKRP